MGRNRKPTALKIHEGTFREDRAIENEMMPALLVGIPSPPPFLSAIAKKEWRSVCGELLELDMLHRVDLPLLASYCQEMATYIEANKNLRKEGYVLSIERQDGSSYCMPNPWASIKNKSLENALKIAGKFGFTPSDRSRIAATPGDKDSEFAEMMNMDDE